jgi:hypothetical protein
MKKQILAVMLPLLCGLSACRKDGLTPNTYPPPIDYTVLPPATQTGAGTFGCLVDGKVWVPRVPLLAVTYRDIEALVSEKNGTGGGGILCYWSDDSKYERLSIAFGSTFFYPIKNCEPAAEVQARF